MDDDQKQFSVMVRQNKNTIFTVCYMFSKDQEEVNDLFQEVLIRLWQGFDNYKGNSKERTWIYRVALNTCISFDRKKRRHNKKQVYMGMTSSVVTSTTPSRQKFYISASHDSAHSIVPLSCYGSRTLAMRR